MKMKNLFKAEKGLIRVKLDVDNNIIKKASITGDFFIIPEINIKILEESLENTEFNREGVEKAIDKFYKAGSITPFVTKDDFILSIMGAKNDKDKTN
jgi:hypothetical protein